MYLLKPRGELTELANVTAQPSRAPLMLKSASRCMFSLCAVMLLQVYFGQEKVVPK